VLLSKLDAPCCLPNEVEVVGDYEPLAFVPSKCETETVG
jgi:hypothetical protein